MRLKGKRILITGSERGIGAVMARVFVGEGGRVMVHGLDRENAKRVAEPFGDKAAFFAADLGKAESAKQLIDATVGALGGLDGVVNNAAYIPRTNLFTTDAALFDACMAVNVRAPMLLIQAAYEHLKASKGSVLNIGSVNAYCGEPNLLPYSISKGALMTLTRNLADALGPDGIRVNQVNPGWVFSESEDRVQQGLGKPKGWQHELPKGYSPSGRILTPEELSAIAIYWMSDESKIVSGTVMELEQYPIIGRNASKDDVNIAADQRG